MKVNFSRYEEQPGHNVFHVDFEPGPEEDLDEDSDRNRVVRILEGMRLVTEKFWLTAPIEDVEKMIKEIDSHPVIVKPEAITVDLDAPKHPELSISGCDRGMIMLDDVDVLAVHTTYDKWMCRLQVDVWPSERARMVSWRGNQINLVSSMGVFEKGHGSLL